MLKGIRSVCGHVGNVDYHSKHQTLWCLYPRRFLLLLLPTLPISPLLGLLIEERNHLLFITTYYLLDSAVFKNLFLMMAAALLGIASSNLLGHRHKDPGLTTLNFGLENSLMLLEKGHILDCLLHVPSSWAFIALSLVKPADSLFFSLSIANNCLYAGLWHLWEALFFLHYFSIIVYSELKELTLKIGLWDLAKLHSFTFQTFFNGLLAEWGVVRYPPTPESPRLFSRCLWESVGSLLNNLDKLTWPILPLITFVCSFAQRRSMIDCFVIKSFVYCPFHLLIPLDHKAVG